MGYTGIIRPDMKLVKDNHNPVDNDWQGISCGKKSSEI